MRASGEGNSRRLIRIPALQGCASLASPFQEKVPVQETTVDARMGRQAGSGGAAEGKAAQSGWQEQLQPDNELAQDWGSSMGVLAVFPLAWHCSMWE